MSSDKKKIKFQQKYGPWAIIAGAAEGIGEGFSKYLAKMGLNLVMLDYNEQALKKLVDKLKQEFQIEIRSLVIDLSVSDILMRVVEITRDIEIGFLVYVAAKSTVGSFFRYPVETQQLMVNLNCRSPMLLTHEFGKLMRERKRGGIILLSSFTGFFGSPMFAHYGATKAYNLSLAEALWDELKPHNVDVMAVCPGRITTPTYNALELKGGKKASFPPEMTADEMVKKVFQKFGKQPYIVPGFWNSFSSFMMTNFMSRVKAVKTMGNAGRNRYPE